MLVVIVSGLHWRLTILVSKCFVIVAQFRSTDVVCHINRVCHWLSTRVWRNLLFTTHSIVLFHLHQCPCLPWLQLPVDTIAFHAVLPFYLFCHILISSFPFSNLNKIKYIFFSFDNSVRKSCVYWPSSRRLKTYKINAQRFPGRRALPPNPRDQMRKKISSLGLMWQWRSRDHWSSL